MFSKVAANKEAGVILYEALRSSVIPSLNIRHARVEDHDDMLPILHASESR